MLCGWSMIRHHTTPLRYALARYFYPRTNNEGPLVAVGRLYMFLVSKEVVIEVLILPAMVDS